MSGKLAHLNEIDAHPDDHPTIEELNDVIEAHNALADVVSALMAEVGAIGRVVLRDDPQMNPPWDNDLVMAVRDAMPQGTDAFEACCLLDVIADAGYDITRRGR